MEPALRSRSDEWVYIMSSLSRNLYTGVTNTAGKTLAGGLSETSEKAGRGEARLMRKRYSDFLLRASQAKACAWSFYIFPGSHLLGVSP